MLGFCIVLQIISQVQVVPGQPAGVAYMAHIGGFVAGIVLVFLLAPGHAAWTSRRTI